MRRKLPASWQVDTCAVQKWTLRRAFCEPGFLPIKLINSIAYYIISDFQESHTMRGSAKPREDARVTPPVTGMAQKGGVMRYGPAPLCTGHINDPSPSSTHRLSRARAGERRIELRAAVAEETPGGAMRFEEVEVEFSDQDALF